MDYNKHNKDKINCATNEPSNECPPKFAEKYRHLFSNYTHFNKIQTRAIDTILKTDKSIVVSSPTGSGNRVIFELAVIRFLETLGKFTDSLKNSKILYVAPIKALCSERYEDWKNKFAIHGLKCIEITGDTEFPNDAHLIKSYQLIITTPEKWDSLMRKCRELKNQLYMFKLFLIDEIHLINEENHGATLETIVSRIKAMPDFALRFVALSAAVQNIEDIAIWLGNGENHPANCLKSNEDERPVKLQKIVLGYYYGFNSFKFDRDLTYELKPLIKRYSNKQPTLVFCSTRKSVEYTCSILVQDATFSLDDDKQRSINEFLIEINNNKIKEMIKLGIGCYHAGMSLEERNVVAYLFRMGYLNILVVTSTLAMGVNLPAHLVIIKSTEYYTFNGYKEYNESQILQMIERAGRPQFDTSATAIIMTKKSLKDWYEKLLKGNQYVESLLHKHLIEHLNAEIFLGTIHDVTVVMDWLRSTFLYVRACKSPQNYGMIKTHNIIEIENRLQNLCLTEIKSLSYAGLINFLDGNNKITSKPESEIMAKYYISFATMKLYMRGNESLSDMLRILSHSIEFEHIKLRKIELEKLNILNKNKLPCAASIRFPIDEGINTRESKINCLLQATLGTLKITDASLAQDANKILLISIRLTKALKEITFRGTKFEIARVACILAKCVLTRLWEQSKFVSKLIPKIGPVLSGDFVLNGKTTLKSIRETDPRDLERFLNRNPPFGNHIHDFIRQIPKYKVRVSFDKYLELVNLKITLIDHDKIVKNVRYHTISIIVGNSENHLLKVQQIRNDEFSELEGIINMPIPLQSVSFSDKPDYTVIVCLISDQWVGIDVEIKLKPGHHEQHIIKESTSEENCTEESPLKTLPLPHQKKKLTSSKAKQRKTEKTQLNIKTYLQNVSSKDQDPKVINKVRAEKDEVTTKCDVNESNVATQNITGKMIGTQTNSQYNGPVNEYFKFDENHLNKYFCYEELISDDVFSDLFVPDDNLYAISQTFDSALENYCFEESSNQRNYLKNKIKQVIKPKQIRCPRRSFSMVRMENMNSGVNNVCGQATSMGFTKSNQITRENFNQNNRNRLKNNENINSYKSDQTKKRLPFGILQQAANSVRRQRPSTPPTNTSIFSVKNNCITDDVRLKILKKKHSLFSSSFREPYQKDLSSDIGSCQLVTTAQPKANSKNLDNTPQRASGRLSRLIETNLKTSTNFYVGPGNFSKVIADRCCEENNFSIGACARTGLDRVNTASDCRTISSHRGKFTLDKYFGSTKTSHRLPLPKTVKAAKTIDDDGLTKSSNSGRRLNALQIDDDLTMQSPQRTSSEHEFRLFSAHFPTHYHATAYASVTAHQVPLYSLTSGYTQRPNEFSINCCLKKFNQDGYNKADLNDSRATAEQYLPYYSSPRTTRK